MTEFKPEYTGQALDLKPTADLDEWQPMDTAPISGLKIEVWNRLHQCVMTVRFVGLDVGRPLSHIWANADESATWPGEAFSAWRHPSKGPK